MSRYLIIAALFLWLAPGPASAQPTPAEDAARIVELTLTEQIFEAALASQAPFIAAAIENEMRASGITLSDPARFTQIVGEVMMEEFILRMREVTAMRYVELFSAADLSAMRAFYESDAGAALIAATPALTLAGAEDGGRIGGEVIAVLGPALADRLERVDIQITTDPSMLQRLLDVLR